MELIREMMREWYVLLSQASVTLSAPLKEFTDGIQMPLVTALLLGLVGSLSPCQLTTNLSAIAYVSRKTGAGEAWREALAYAAAKLLVYSLAGGLVIFAGLKLQQSAVPVVVVARKIIGPLMIIVGLGLVGAIRLRGSFGDRIAGRLRSRLPQGRLLGAFSLGVAFSFTFCPTLFWLFFGFMIPLALISPVGLAFPGFFAIGTLLPLLIVAGLSSGAGRWTPGLSSIQRHLSRISGGIILLAGIHDTFTYWLI